MLHSARLACILPRLWNWHTPKWIQAGDKSFLLQSFTNADQLPLGLKNEPGGICRSFVFFSFLLAGGYGISFSASSRIYCCCFPAASLLQMSSCFMWFLQPSAPALECDLQTQKHCLKAAVWTWHTQVGESHSLIARVNTCVWGDHSKSWVGWALTGGNSVIN